MRHLSDEALVDLAEGGVSGRDHLDACRACRERVESMRQMMGVVLDDRVPEPSPLFWEHLSDRVGRAVDEAAPASDWRGLSRWGWAVATAAAIMIAALIIRPARTPDLAALADPPAATSASQVARGSAGAANDVSWAVTAVDDPWQIVEGAAADLDLDAAVDAGIFMRGGSLDRELLMLSDQERHDLARAIQAELDRSRL
jgi:hypothetical protein